MTAKVSSLPRALDAAYRAWDAASLRFARMSPDKGIKAAKHVYAEKIQAHLHDTGDTRGMWQGIQALRGYKARQQVTDTVTSLPDKLNNFFARFDAAGRTPKGRASPWAPSDQPVLIMDTHKTPSKVNPQKSAGLDNIPGWVLKECADELADVLKEISNISLSQVIVPTCFKTSTIISISEISVVTCLNDYQPNS